MNRFNNHLFTETYMTLCILLKTSQGFPAILQRFFETTAWARLRPLVRLSMELSATMPSVPRAVELGVDRARPT